MLSRVLPHRFYILSLTEDEYLRQRYKLYKREYAYERLKNLTGEDFAYDVDAWEAWFKDKSFAEIDRICKSNKQKPKD